MTASIAACISVAFGGEKYEEKDALDPDCCDRWNDGSFRNGTSRMQQLIG